MTLTKYQKIAIGVGLLASAGVAYYFYNKGVLAKMETHLGLKTNDKK